jgi:hypothetical protein
MTSTIKVNNIQNQCGQNIINENSNTITIGASGDTIALASGASQTGFGREGSVDWQTGSIKTTTFTATSGEGYFVDTSSGAVTANLPAGSAGAIVAFADYTRTFNSNNLTITPNGSEKIGGIAGNAILTVNGQSATFVYVDGTEGWINVQETQTSQTALTPFIVATGGTITTCGNDRIHTFTGPGTFTVCNAAAICGATRNIVSYMVVAGGGSATFAGGGGAGGFRELKSPLTPYTASPLDGYPTPGNRITVSAQAYPITVGAGGAGTPKPNSPKGTPGNNGSNSVFSTIISSGGGWGGVASPNGPEANNGNTGGSGGGGGVHRNPGGGKPGAAGNTPPVSPPQGNSGGKGSYDGATHTAGGGGGGAGGAGGNSPGGCSTASPAPGGTGGTGVGTGINPASPVGTPGPSGPLRYFAGGGRGGTNTSAPAPDAAGSVGGGGAGNEGGTSNPACNGATNTGGGAGGFGELAPTTNTSGGSGIVIIRYKFQ